MKMDFKRGIRDYITSSSYINDEIQVLFSRIHSQNDMNMGHKTTFMI